MMTASLTPLDVTKVSDGSKSRRWQKRLVLVSVPRTEAAGLNQMKLMLLYGLWSGVGPRNIRIAGS